MNWIRTQAKLKNENSSPKENASPERKKRTEEISDIIDRMPMAFGRWVALFILLFACLLLGFGWVIRYPDIVTGKIKINSDRASVRLVANASGRIRLLEHQAQNEVSTDEYLAVIQNPAQTEDVRKIAGLLRRFSPNSFLSAREKHPFPDKVSLGDLDLKYYAFLSSLQALADYAEGNIYEKQKKSLLDDIAWKKRLIAESEAMLETCRQKADLSKKWFERYASLNKEVVTTYELEVDQAESSYLGAKLELQTLAKEIASMRMQIANDANRLKQLEIEQREKERTLKVDLFASYHDLDDNIKAWEQKYVLKAPFDGKVEFLQFLSEGQFVQAGEELIGVVPKENRIYGQAFLPANGAGKVKVGSRVSIKLDNYPYLEYGLIDGKVSSISLISSQVRQTAENTAEIYLITIDLPDGLKTNYGETLDFKYEIAGTADIVVRERRLLERLFDNLKYRTKHRE